MYSKNLHRAPIWDDIMSLDGHQFYGHIDIIFGGFPCQDISIAGNGKGLDGERSGLFFEIMRLAKEIKPSFIFLENVPAITSRGGLRVVNEVAEMGYDCRWCVISAASVGAKHRRERWFLLAHANDYGSSANSNRRSSRECVTSWQKSRQPSENIGETERTISLSRDVADAHGERFEKELRQPERQAQEFTFPDIQTQYGSPDQEPENKLELVGVANDVPYRSHRIRALGNSVVPTQAKEAFRILLGISC